MVVKPARLWKVFPTFLGGIVAPCIVLSGPAAQSEVRASEPVAVNAWTVEEGLPGNTVSAIEQTRDGYLWVGGLNGLARFDGARFVRFRLRDGLSSLHILRLLEDQQGRLWIGTQDGGLTVREDGRFRSYRRSDGLPGEYVHGLAQDARGRIWVALENGLVRWDGRFTDMSPPHQGEKQVGYNSVYCAGELVWAVSDDWRVWELRDEKWRPLPRLEKGKFRFDQVFATQDGSLWSRLYPYGLARLEKASAVPANQTPQESEKAEEAERWRLFGTECALPQSYISSVLERGDGNLLCGSYESGMFAFKENRAAGAGLNRGAERDGVLSLRQDAVGNLWVGTRTHGLLRLRQPRVWLLPGAQVVRIARLAFDSRGKLWLGGGEGLWCGEEGNFSAVPRPNQSAPFSVLALMPSASGGVWIGAQNAGLWRFDPAQDRQPMQESQAVPGDASVTALANDGSGGVWVGTDAGMLARLSEAGSQLAASSDAAGGKRIAQLTAEPDGGVWAATVGAGVVRVGPDGKVALRLGTKEGLPLKSVRCLLRDSAGTVWIGTAAGLCRWQNRQLTVFDARHGLPEEAIASLVEDQSGKLWCGANNRLFRLDKQELEEVAAGRLSSAHPMSVGPSDGLKAASFASGIPPEAIHGPNGRLFFPRIWDVLALNPADFDQPASPPQAVIEDAFIDGQPAPLPANEASALRVPPRRAQLEIRYTAFQWAAPETVRFRYRLEGLDNAWTEAGDQRLAGFRRVPPGSYRFRVAASAGGGPWAEPGASLAVIILPAWYQTWWFRSLAAAAAVGLLLAAYSRRVARLERARLAEREFSRRLIESQEQERKRIAAGLHDSLEQNLLVIKNRALLALSCNGMPSLLKDSLDEISTVSSDSINEVRAIANNLRPHQLTRLGLTRALTAMLRNVADSSGLKLASDIDEVKGMLTEENEIHLYRIVQESLNNLQKHSEASQASVTLRREPERLTLRVRDNGRGFDPAAAPREGAGFGLTGVAERAKMLGGQLKLVSSPGNGTELQVEIPAGALRNTKAPTAESSGPT